jgi:hypothetical protein
LVNVAKKAQISVHPSTLRKVPLRVELPPKISPKF